MAAPSLQPARPTTLRLAFAPDAASARAVAGAIRRLLTDDVFHSACVMNLERVRPRFAWEVVTRPLADAVTQWLT